MARLPLKIKNKLKNKLNYAPWIDFLEDSFSTITKILPHIELVSFRICSLKESNGIKWGTSTRRFIKGYLVLTGNKHKYRRRKLKYGIEFIAKRRSKSVIESKTLDLQEFKLLRVAINRIRTIFRQEIKNDNVLNSFVFRLDEIITAEYLRETYGLTFDIGKLFQNIRKLAEQTYENKALTFGCIIESDKKMKQSVPNDFAEEFLIRKRYRALSDGYYTAYLLSRHGKLLEFLDLEKHVVKADHRSFFPSWCKNLMSQSKDNRLSICLTRQGDILVFENKCLRFTYRLGRWQYWNHTHIVNMLKEIARVQRVPRAIVPRVVRAIYRAALDISFRRTGGLFVLLRNRNDLRKIAREGDAIMDDNRLDLDKRFDISLPQDKIYFMPKSIILELSALDGAVILNNYGEILAYGAILEPKRKGKIVIEEGSRTKAAKGASNYGLVVKISSDGDITIFSEGTEFLKI
jgi:DNA integrity scanning protein DisA with diadenylate cyclase activity